MLPAPRGAPALVYLQLLLLPCALFDLGAAHAGAVPEAWLQRRDGPWARARRPPPPQPVEGSYRSGGRPRSDEAAAKAAGAAGAAGKGRRSLLEEQAELEQREQLRWSVAALEGKLRALDESAAVAGAQGVAGAGAVKLQLHQRVREALADATSGAPRPNPRLLEQQRLRGSDGGGGQPRVKTDDDNHDGGDVTGQEQEQGAASGRRRLLGPAAGSGRLRPPAPVVTEEQRQIMARFQEVRRAEEAKEVAARRDDTWGL
jgi:hypothetical protein